MSQPHVGRFVWSELLTPSASSSFEFYQSLFGWSSESLESEHPYLTVEADGATIAGVMESPPETACVWIPYLEVEDVDAASVKIPALGGALLCRPFDAPAGGRAVFATDPKGASFAAFSGPDVDRDAPEDAPLGSMAWRELQADDPELATFYAELVGWIGEPAGTERMRLKKGDRVVGGLQLGTAPDARWVSYVRVAELDVAKAAAAGLGASVVSEPVDAPGLGRLCVMADPDGAVFGLLERA